jgi:hypothetical protein
MQNSSSQSAVIRLRPAQVPGREAVTERGRGGSVGQTPARSGARVGCGPAAPNGSDEWRRQPRACLRIVSLFMTSRDPAVNLRLISRSAAAAFSRCPGESACVLVRLPGPAAVSYTRQNPDTPTRLVSLPASESVSLLLGRGSSATSRLRPAKPDCVQHPESSFASGTRRPLSSQRALPTRAIRANRPSSDRAFGSLGFSPGAQAVSTPIVSNPDTLAVSVPIWNLATPYIVVSYDIVGPYIVVNYDIVLKTTI